MARPLALLWLLLLATACTSPRAASPGEPREIHIGSSVILPPDLANLAATTREWGGYVFVGTLVDDAALPSEIVPGPRTGLFLAYPRFLGTIAVDDAMGAALPASIDVTVADGPATLVDESGAPNHEWRISGNDPVVYEHLTMPPTGRYLCFVIPHDGHFVLRWFTAVDGDVADGDGTSSGLDTPLADLRLAMP